MRIHREQTKADAAAEPRIVRAHARGSSSGADARVTRAQLNASQIRVLVAAAAAAFEGRWTHSALGRHDPRWLARLVALRSAWRDADPDDEVAFARAGRAVVRAYEACSGALEAARDAGAVSDSPDASYWLGRAPDGRQMAIGRDRSAAAVVAERHPGVPFYTVDDVAALLTTSQNKLVSSVMAEFPGAEVVEVRDGDRGN